MRNVADPVLVGLYVASSLSQAILMLISVYLAYRITRIVGVFWAWSLIGIAFMLFFARDVNSVVSLLATPVAQLTAKTDVLTITSYWPGAIINESAYATLTVGMYGLYKIFAKNVHRSAD